jgi:hypothetical protein
MRLLRDKRGNVRVIEALLASMLLLSSLTLIPVAQERAENPAGTLASTARQALLSLNGDGHLSDLIDQRDWGAIRSCVQSCFPFSMWFNLTVFDENMTCLNSVPISTGSLASQNTASVDIVIANTNSTFSVYVVRLQIGRLG